MKENVDNTISEQICNVLKHSHATSKDLSEELDIGEGINYLRMNYYNHDVIEDSYLIVLSDRYNRDFYEKCVEVDNEYLKSCYKNKRFPFIPPSLSLKRSW